MEPKKVKDFLPNPDAPRAPTVELCEGCEKTYDDGQLPLTVCKCYATPEVKWRSYRREEEEVEQGGKKKKKVYHYNPCPMATHIKHSPKVKLIRGRKGWKKGKAW